jgi:hypothetical protein
MTLVLMLIGSLPGSLEQVYTGFRWGETRSPLAGNGDLSSISQEKVVTYNRDEDNDCREGDDEGREVA